jgi:hypothetical protein
VKDHATIVQEPAAPSQPSFQQLLAAAFIVQEHNDKLQSNNDPDAAYTRTLAEIVETERLIQDQRIDSQTAVELIAERTHTITRADGVAVGVLENGKLVYRADTGDTASQSKFPVLITDSLAAECFRTGKALQSAETRNDDRIDQALRQGLGVESLLAIPIRQEGKIAGVLELRFKRANAYQSYDLRTCQLMSGLIGEVLTRKVKQGWKQALASSEEDAIGSVLDQIQPELDRFEDRDDEFDRAVCGLTAETHSVDLTEPRRFTYPPVDLPAKPQAKRQYSQTMCGNCGHEFVQDEAFCGLCGAMRDEASSVVASPQASSWPSLWDMQESSEPAHRGDMKAPSNRYQLAGTVEPNIEDEVSRLSDEPESEFEETPYAHFSSHARERADRLEPTAAADENATAEAEEVDANPGFGKRISELWREQRAMFYLAAAVGLLASVIVGWAMQPPVPPQPVAATAPADPQAPPKTELSMVDKMLVNLGLAEAPAPPVYLGNPDARVWVDVHTALYYCAGADLYGHTKGGRFTKQRDAQLDQFQPSARKVCD